jgi:hypothetical protein
MRARLNGGMDPVDNTTETLWRERLGNRLAAQMALKPAYSLRFIGIEDNHREILRVDRSGPNGAVRIVPEAELKRVGDVPYFQDTTRLAADQVYVSPIHLHEENGETPQIPVMQVATPVMTSDGKPYGIVIVDVDMRPALDRARSSVRQGESAYLVGRNGDYLIHPDTAREFGSQRGAPADWRRDMPISRAWPAQRKVSRSNPTRTVRPAASRSRRSYSPAVNGSPSSSRYRERSSWRRRRGSRTARLPSG